MFNFSIIIPTFNSRKFIKSCLNSIFSQNYQDFEVIIVDNGSKDETLSFIKENYPQVILIENKMNLGTCKARNQGISVSKGEYILTLDCDIILEKDFFEKIVEFAKCSGRSIGSIQPKILNKDKKTIYSYGIYLSKLKRFYDIGKGRIDNGQFKNSEYIFGACSASALYRRQMLEEIKENDGYFDERFFFLVEDVDLAWRAQRNGWSAIFYPKAVCYHAGNSSSTNNKFRQYLCYRNRLYMLRKNEYFFGKIRLILLGFWYEILLFIYMMFTNKYFLLSFAKQVRP
jgi:hypothetical protein